MSTRQLVEAATVSAGLQRIPLCYVCDKPRARVEYARGSRTQIEGEARVSASIEDFYNECRAKRSPAWVGD